jgi:diguanylate cyclase (GGDEF)-like protein/PAS domain S-box-containing protein
MTASVPTVLIVDDEAKNRRLLAVLLQPEGYKTTSVASGEEALCSVASEAPDLILLDQNMPGIDGYQVATILKANPATENIPIIMVTGQEEICSRLAGLEAGAEEFLTKPVDPTELGLRVRNLLRLKELSDIEEHCFVLERQVAARTADLERFRMAMNATADAIMLVSRDTMRFVEVNDTTCTMLGYSRDEMLTLGPVALGAATHAELEQMFSTITDGQVNPKLSEVALHCKDGSVVQVEIHRQAMLSGNDWIIVSVVRDITERKLAQQSLQYQASHDALTDLPNRAHFYEVLHREIDTCSGTEVAVMFIDLDHFKNVNDTLGHLMGDDLLVQFSARLLNCVGEGDTVARLGGDEFGLILVLDHNNQRASLVAAQIADSLQLPFNLRGFEVILTASVGITVHPQDGKDPETLIKYADTAMYEAKHAGRDTYRFFTAQMNIDALQRQDLEHALRKAIVNEEFEMYYQPKVMLSDDTIVGVEALLRWNRPGYGVVPPCLFVPVLEETGMIVRVGRWVIDAACRQISQWLLGETGPMQVSVNIAGRQFAEGDLEGDVTSALTKYSIPSALLELELTETSLMLNTERTMECLRNLRQRGIKVSVDDFGTGYSSLAYLRRFPIDKLKIDIAFIRDVTTNADDAAIVNAIITMAHSLHMLVVAEGVETAVQRAYLIEHGCDQIQGYLISRPLPSVLITKLMALRKGVVLAPA